MIIDLNLHCILLRFAKVLSGRTMTFHTSQRLVLELNLDGIVVSWSRARTLRVTDFIAGISFLTRYRPQATPQRRCLLLMLADSGVLSLDGEWTLTILCTKLNLWWALVSVLAIGKEYPQLLLLCHKVNGEVCESMLGNG